MLVFVGKLLGDKYREDEKYDLAFGRKAKKSVI